MSARDSSNTHEVINAAFRAMNIKIANCAAGKLPNWANGFPYVNGELFSGSTELPRFSRMARTYLLHAGELSWREINPDIFSSMIQAVAEDEERVVSSNPENRLGNLLGQILARDKAHIVEMTGSYFRGDAEAVLTPQDEARFETVTNTYYEQLNGTPTSENAFLPLRSANPRRSRSFVGKVSLVLGKE